MTFLGLYHLLFALETIGISEIIIWWLIFEKRPFQFWREIWIWVVVILSKLYIWPKIRVHLPSQYLNSRYLTFRKGYEIQSESHCYGSPSCNGKKNFLIWRKCGLRREEWKEPNKHYTLEIDRNTRFVFIFKTLTLNFYGFVVKKSIF